jgi:hypothetical protein
MKFWRRRPDGSSTEPQYVEVPPMATSPPEFEPIMQELTALAADFQKRAAGAKTGLERERGLDRACVLDHALAALAECAREDAGLPRAEA